MFHFVQFHLESTNPEATEEAIRHFSSKRQTSLDLKSTAAVPGETKYFMGLEDQDKLQITRFRFLIERLMPKLIVTFRKSEHFLSYNVRLSLPSFVLFLLLASSGLYNIFDCLFRGDKEGGITSVVIILFILVLTFIELLLTRRKIHQAIVSNGL